MNVRPHSSAILLAILVLVVPTMAQSPSAPPDSGTKPSADEAYRAALSAMTALEEGDQSQISPAVFEETNRLLTALRVADPAHPRLTYLVARFNALAGRSGDAIEQLRRFVDTREGRNEWEAHRRLGDLFVNEYPQLAKASYERAGELKANEPAVLLGLSNCAYKVGQLDEALRLARQAVEADGRKTVRVIGHLARMSIAKQQWSEAEKASAQAVELALKKVEAAPGRRRPLEELDSQYQLVVDLIQSRIAEAAAGPDDYLRLAGFFRKRNELAAKLNLHECLRIVETGVNALPSPPARLLEEYAVLLAEVGRTDDARASFEKVLALDPANVTAAQWLERLRPPPPTN